MSADYMYDGHKACVCRARVACMHVGREVVIGPPLPISGGRNLSDVMAHSRNQHRNYCR